VTAVIAIMIVFLTSSNSPFKTQLNTTVTSVVAGMSDEADILEASHANNGTGPTPQPPYNVDVAPPGQ
jgi:hypothetical protein